MNKRFRDGLQWLTAVLACVCLAAPAAAVDIPIVSGSAWRSTNAAPPPDWTGTGFDDSAWRQAYAPYPNDITTPDDIAGEPSAAQLMWDWPGPGLPTGTDGPNQAWFRYSFNLALTPSSLPLLAQALLIADDEFELYINGHLYNFGGSTALDNNKRPNGQPRPLFADFTSLLQNGINVLAIHAADNALGDPADRFNEYVYFEGRIVTVPEPGSALLILLALLLMAAWAARVRPRGQ